MTKALARYPRDMGVAIYGFKLANFIMEPSSLHTELDSEDLDNTALLICHQGLFAMALRAILDPFDAWSSTDFKSAGNVFWAVAKVDSAPEGYEY